MYSARNKDQNLLGCFFKDRMFCTQIFDCCPTDNVQEVWPTKMDFDRPNAEVGQKMANGRLLFLALM